MPDWVASVLIAGAAMTLIVWLVSLVGVKPRDFLSALVGLNLNERSRVAPPRRKVSSRRTIVTLVGLGGAALLLLWLLSSVFSLPPGPPS